MTASMYPVTSGPASLKYCNKLWKKRFDLTVVVDDKDDADEDDDDEEDEDELPLFFLPIVDFSLIFFFK